MALEEVVSCTKQNLKELKLKKEVATRKTDVQSDTEQEVSVKISET